MGLLIPRTPEAEKRVRRAIDRLRRDDSLVDGKTIVLAAGVLSVRVQQPLDATSAGIVLELGEGLELDGSGQLAIENLTGASKGDIMVYDGTALQRLPVGFDGQVLAADSSTPTGLSWVDPAGSGSGVNNGSAAGGLVTSGEAGGAVDYVGEAQGALTSSGEADGEVSSGSASAFSSAYSSAFGA